jgi:hypothetical protein
MTQQAEGSMADRRIPRWAAALLARWAQDRPTVLTRQDVAEYLAELGSDRQVDSTIRELVRLGWLKSSRRKGVWAFLAPGEDAVADPYVDLRAWAARDRSVVLALAGEAAAWHLGYLDRRHVGPTPIWLPGGDRPPFGVRTHVSVVRLGWTSEVLADIAPSRELLRRRNLDLTRWAGGLEAFGPEALLVQLSARPASFKPWADLVVHLGSLAGDVEVARLLRLLTGQSSSAWQRAAYLLDLGEQSQLAGVVLDQRPNRGLSHVMLGAGTGGEFSSRFKVTDHLAAPYLRRAGKA